MSKDEKDGVPRRQFLINTAKVVTSAAIPIVLAPKGCDKNEEECPPKKSGVAPKKLSAKWCIIGTGFGATVAVTELLKKKSDLNVLLLERGPWWLTPDASHDLEQYVNSQGQPRQFFTRPDHTQGARYLLSILKTNLFNRRSNIKPLYMHHGFPDIDVLTASGVGGGSLVYLNVTIPPIPADDGTFPIFNEWPMANKLNSLDYDKALQWMYDWRWGGPTENDKRKLNRIFTEYPLPLDIDQDSVDLDRYATDNNYRFLGKSKALKEASIALMKRGSVGGRELELLAKWRPAPLSVNELGKNADEGCTRQGRCFLGCLPGAIRTLDKSLLRGILSNKRRYPNVSLESLKNVSHIRYVGPNNYVVYGQDEDGEFELSAENVIVAAGTLGSTEILLRSAGCNSLTLNPGVIGTKFSGNGDLGGFISNVRKLDYPINLTRGPMITSYVQFGTRDGLQMTVEDGGIPPTFAAFTRLLLNFLDPSTQSSSQSMQNLNNKIQDLWSSGDLPNLEPVIPGKPDPANRKSYQTEQEMLEDVFYFQCMGKDEANGKFSLDTRGKLSLGFASSPLNHPVYKALEDIMREMAVYMGGNFIPFTSKDGGLLKRNGISRRLFTLHPLGGCPIGRNNTEGVVNENGQVFKYGQAIESTAVHEGLYVIDASIFPGPVAVNPTLSIVALALRITNNIPV